MEIEENHFNIVRQLRYCTVGNRQSKKLLVVLHGYGQLAKFFIRKFSDLQNDFLILAPEGVHRFYLNGSSGRVGASWMTKEDRLNDINANNQMLNSLVTFLQKNNACTEVTVLGFSQGGATVARFCSETKLKITELILWACVFPPDLEAKMDQLNKLKKTFVLGHNDEYFRDEEVKTAVEFYKDLGFKTKLYRGTHDIDSTTLKTLFKS